MMNTTIESPLRNNVYYLVLLPPLSRLLTSCYCNMHIFALLAGLLLERHDIYVPLAIVIY